MTGADRRVLVFGDSVVAGVGDPEGRGWVGRVVEASFAAGVPLTAYPLGVRRETSVEVARRWRAEARPRVAADADCRVVFAVGVNDAGLQDGVLRVEPDVTVATLAAMLDGAAALGLPALVLGPSPVCDAAHNERLEELGERFRRVCAMRGVAFVGVLGALVASAIWLREAASGDGAHPGAVGYDTLAALVIAGGWLEWLGSRGDGGRAGAEPRGEPPPP